MSISLTKMGLFIKLILAHFDWSHVVLITHESSLIISLIRHSIQQTLEQAANISLTVIEITRPLDKVNLGELLIDGSKEGRG